MKPIILIGGGGHCISCIDVLRAEGKFEIVGILDIAEKVGNKVNDIHIIGTDDDIPYLAAKYSNFLITIGQIKSSVSRERIYEIVKNNNGNLPVIISPRSYLSPYASVSEGTILMHNSFVNINSNIGKVCIVNTGALVEHESVVGDFCHISTYAVINGQVKIGSCSFIGSNSVIANNLVIPKSTVIAAGACVITTPEISGIYIGNPAKRKTES